MDNPILMGDIESQSDLIQNVEDFIHGRTGILFQKGSKVLPIQEFHDQIRKAPVVQLSGSEVSDIYHIRMAQTASSFRLPLKSEKKLIFSRELRNNHFDRNRPGSSQVGRPKHRAHSALAKLLLDPILLIQNDTRQ
jgi:hypothetical protein